MDKSKTFCVFCKDCDKPFSVAVAEFAYLDKGWARETRKYKKQGYRVALVESFDGNWCDCQKKGKPKPESEETQMELFA